MKVISYGGGVQSTAMLVLANQGVIEGVDAALFSNVGDDSEHPATLEYVRQWAMPESVIPVHELNKEIRGRGRIGLRQYLEEGTKAGKPNDIIPLRNKDGVPLLRGCTGTFKIGVVGRWLREHGATPENPATVCIGISTDEIHRVNRKRAEAWENPTYPLIDLGLDRSACAQLIADHGWPVPRASSCYFCPFNKPQVWAEMRRDEPDLFQASVDLERLMNERRKAHGKGDLYLTRFGKPLDEAIGEAQDMLPLIEWDTCDSGHCMT